MSRAVCGICWCPYDEDTGACACEPNTKAMTCPSCEYNKQRAQLWRNEAYKLGGNPLDWEPELMVRPKPLTEEKIETVCALLGFAQLSPVEIARAIERAHGIGEKE